MRWLTNCTGMNGLPSWNLGCGLVTSQKQLSPGWAWLHRLFDGLESTGQRPLAAIPCAQIKGGWGEGGRELHS